METLKNVLLVATAVIAVAMVTSGYNLRSKLLEIESLSAPTLNVSPLSLAQRELKAIEISNYKELILARQTQVTTRYDFVILQTLLPLFTVLLAGIVASAGLKIYQSRVDKM